MDQLATWLFPAIPVAGVAVLVIFIIGLAMEGRSTGSRGKGLKHAFYYSLALLMLGLSVGSGIFLVNLGLKATVLPKADVSRYYNTPPAPFFEPRGDSVGPFTSRSCADSCELTDSDKQRITEWRDQYRQWRAAYQDPGARYQRDAVNGFSFFIIAVPLFILFWRLIRRETVGEGEPGQIRSFYFYGFALFGLLMAVVSAALLTNLALRTWVFPKAGNADTPYGPGPVAERSVSAPEAASVDTIKNCAANCGLRDDDVALADQWTKDMAEIRDGQQKGFSNRQRDLAAEIPVLAAGLPLFFYHFIRIRRESRKEGPTPMSPGTSA